MKRGKDFTNQIAGLVFVASVSAFTTTIAAANVPQTIFAEGNLLGSTIFADTLALNESKSFTVRANDPYNYTHIKAITGQRYRFTVASPAWNNGLKETDAGGYNDTGPYANTRRHLDYKTMALVVELHNSAENPLSYFGRKLLVGLGPREWTASVTGYMVAFANDCLPCYADNSRVVTLTIRRIPA
jgi:hypothetical protein